MIDIIKAPWTGHQVQQLRLWQKCDWVHPFTCGRDHTHDKPNPEDHVVLTPTSAGWVCPIEGCDYFQDWARGYMFDGPPPKLEIPAVG